MTLASARKTAVAHTVNGRFYSPFRLRVEPMARPIVFLIRPFKQWPKSYEWMATVDLSGHAAPGMTSGWRRIVR